MIEFFRKIRQQLLAQNKFSKYMLYAIGEIVLVVIGILIAVNVNNWNQQIAKKELEINILIEIRDNFIDTKENIERNLALEGRLLQYCNRILDYLDNNRPYNNELDVAFGTYYWSFFVTPSNSGYEYLKQNGFNIVSNNELRKEISSVVDVDLKFVKENSERWAEHMESNISKPFHVKNFRKYFPEESNPVGDEYAKPINYEALKKNEHFKNIIAEIISTRMWNNASLNSTLESLNNIIIMINKELDVLQKEHQL